MSPKQADNSSDGEKYVLEPAGSWDPGGSGCTPALPALLVQFPSPSLFSLIAEQGLPGTACFSPRTSTKLWGTGLGHADPGTEDPTLGKGSDRFRLCRGAMPWPVMVTLLSSVCSGGFNAAPRGALPMGQSRMGPAHPSYPSWGHPQVHWNGWRCQGSTANSQNHSITES